MRLKKDKSGDTVRPSWRSSLPGDPGAKFFGGKPQHMKNSLNFANTCLKVVDTRRAMLIPKPDTRKGEALQVSVASGTGSPLDELLAAVDIVRCSGDGCVRHEVDGEGGDVGRADHAADWQSGAQLLATRV